MSHRMILEKQKHKKHKHLKSPSNTRMTAITSIQVNSGKAIAQNFPGNPNRRYTCVVNPAHFDVSFRKPFLVSVVGAQYWIIITIVDIPVFLAPGHEEHSFGSWVVLMDISVQRICKRQNLMVDVSRREGRPLALIDLVFEKSRKEIFNLLKTTIRPEFLNRIDEIIMFKPLEMDEIKGIARLQLENVKRMLAKSQIKIGFSEAAIEKIAKEGFDPQFGARPIKRAVQRSLLNKLSKMILAGKVIKDSEILMDIRNGELEFVNK